MGLLPLLHSADWRRDKWRVQLVAREELESVIGEPQSRLRATNDVVGILRNYIHGEGLSQTISDDREHATTDYLAGKLVIGGKDAERLVGAAAHHPGLEAALEADHAERVVSYWIECAKSGM
jgi:hypothetical protein